MNKLNILLTKANGGLVGKETAIKRAADTAKEYTFSTLKINWDVDVIVTDKISMMIPENGAGGYTFAADLIRIIVDSKKATEDSITENLVHELCHAARWGHNPEWINSLFDNLIFEGLATFFEAKFAENIKQKTLFLDTILKRTDEENKKLLQLLQLELDKASFDYDTIFFFGNKTIPRWAGYSVGYYLVKRYLSMTNKTIEEAFAEPFDNFRKALP